MLLPFVRLVIVFLLLLTLTAAIVGVARIHMIILSFLSAGTIDYGKSNDGPWTTDSLAARSLTCRWRTLLLSTEYSGTASVDHQEDLQL